MTVWIPNDVRYGISVQIPSLQGLRFCGVDVLQELHIFVSGYDVIIATYSLPDLYLPKMKNASFVAPESNGPSFDCAV